MIDGGHSGNNIAGSKTRSTTANGGMEGGSNEDSTDSPADDSKVGSVGKAPKATVSRTH